MKVNQEFLLDALNNYFATNPEYKPIYSKNGACRGIGLLYIFYKDNNNLNGYNQLFKDIVGWETLNYDVSTSIDKFFSIANWMQDSQKYIPSLTHSKLNETSKFIGLDYEVKYATGATLQRNRWKIILKDALKYQKDILFQSAQHAVICSFKDKPQPVYILMDPNHLFDPDKETQEQFFDNFEDFYAAVELAFDREALRLKQRQQINNDNNNANDLLDMFKQMNLSPEPTTVKKEEDYVIRSLEIVAPINQKFSPTAFPAFVPASVSSFLSPLFSKLQPLSKIASKKELRTADSEGNSSLHQTARLGDLAGLQFLLENQIDVNQRSKAGLTALAYAIRNGHLDCVKLLIENKVSNQVLSHIQNKADVNIKISNVFSILYYACYFGQLDIVDYFVNDLKLDVNTIDKGTECGTPLFVAVHNGHQYIVDLLIKAGANTSFNGSTALIKAIKSDQTAIAFRLLELGLDPHEADQDNLTPLCHAFETRNYSLFEALLDKNADIYHPYQTRTLLHAVAFFGEFLTILLKKIQLSEADILSIYDLSKDKNLSNTAHILLFDSFNILKPYSIKLSELLNGQELKMIIHDFLNIFMHQFSFLNRTASSNEALRIDTAQTIDDI